LKFALIPFLWQNPASKLNNLSGGTIMKKLFILLFALLGVAPCIPFLSAADNPSAPAAPAAVTQQQPMSNMHTGFAQKTGLTQEQITSLRNQNYGYGEIMIMSEIAKKSNQPVEMIAQDKVSGMRWAEITKKYNLKLGEVAANCNMQLNALDKEYKNNADLRQARHQVREARRQESTLRASKAIEKKQMEMEQRKQRIEERQKTLEEKQMKLEKKSSQVKTQAQEAGKAATDKVTETGTQVQEQTQQTAPTTEQTGK
jgi:hypothetical protein